MELQSTYDVVVVGSGYGGAVVAARLAESGLTVCVLERGREHRPGDFAETTYGFLRAASAHLPSVSVGRDDALFRFHFGAHMGALTGVGVGGTSLINAGVLLRPSSLRALGAAVPRDALEAGYAAASAMLRPAVVPPEHAFDRDDALSRRGVTRFERVPLAITYAPTHTEGVERGACTHCGNCITGCNVGAKGTLDANYLPRAVRHGAALFAGATVLRVLRAGSNRWAVEVDFDELRRHRFEATPLRVTARAVVIAAGALGSTELLWRSRAAGLAVSSTLGTRFSGNGTIIGFTIGTADEMNALGEASRRASGRVGPTLLGMFDLRDGAHPMVVQDTAIPRPLASLFRGLTWAAGRGVDRRLVAWSVTAGDRGAGRIVLDNDRLRIDWPGAGREETARAVDAQLAGLASRLGGRHQPNPLWRFLPGAPLITTHPLGGCAMGDRGEDAVVDVDHRVFAGNTSEVHDGLYVCDGAVFNGSLGTNPLWTISALAERCATRVLVHLGDDTPRASAPSTSPTPSPSIGVCFTERMSGWLSPTSATEPAPQPRPADAVDLTFLLTIEWPSVDALASGPECLAASVGTVRCRLLADEPLTVARGAFQLFVDTDGRRVMRHAFEATSLAGERFECVGWKNIVDDPGPDLWYDTRTLFLEVSRVRGHQRILVGRGVVQTRPRDLGAQVSTIRGITPSLREDLQARASFLGTFLGGVREVYGGLVVPLVR